MTKCISCKKEFESSHPDDRNHVSWGYVHVEKDDNFIIVDDTHICFECRLLEMQSESRLFSEIKKNIENMIYMFDDSHVICDDNRRLNQRAVNAIKLLYGDIDGIHNEQRLQAKKELMQ